jgi:hypothetical protein
LINRWNSSVPSTLRDRITITFELVPITGIEFDWQIFPVTVAANADLTVRVWTQQQIDGESAGTIIFQRQIPSGEIQQGDMGHFNYMSFSSPVTRVSFIDWTDAPIGFDNFRVTQTPVPGTLILLGAGFVALGVARRRSKKPAGSSPTSTN